MVTVSLTHFDVLHELISNVNIVWENLLMNWWWVSHDVTPIAP